MEEEEAKGGDEECGEDGDYASELDRQMGGEIILIVEEVEDGGDEEAGESWEEELRRREGEAFRGRVYGCFGGIDFCGLGRCIHRDIIAEFVGRGIECMGARTVSIDKIRKVCYNDNVGVDEFL